MKKIIEFLMHVSGRNVFPLLILFFISTPVALKATLPGVTIGAPTANAASSITSSSFYASWSLVKGATSYNIYVLKKVKIGGITNWMYVTGYNKLPVGGTHTTVTDLWGGTDYKYFVTANQISDESVHSNEIQVTTFCDAPVANTATNVTPISFTANWSAATGAASYKFYMVDADENYIHNGSTVEGTSLSVTGLTPNKLYRYRVSAVNTAGNSEKSNIITLTTPAITPPVAKNATSITTNSFIANWNAVAGATSYLLTVRDVTAGTFKVQDRETEELSNSVTGLKPNNSYSYSVKAKFGDILSDWSDLITVNTKPTPPVATAASNITTTSFNANWGAVAGATGYKLWVISNENTGYNPAGYFPKTIGNVTTYNITGLTSGHSYTYYVQVVTSLGESAASNSMEVTTKPVTPAAMNASNITSTSFMANWQTVIGATGYKLSVWRKSDYNWVPGYDGKVVSGTSEVITGLEPSTEYQYRLRALAGETESDLSNYITVSTLAGQIATYTLTLSSSPAGAGSLSGGGTFNEGVNVTAHAVANQGYTFVNWTENGIVVSESNSYAFQINSNRNLVANFTQTAPKTYIVVVTPSHANRGTVTGSGTYNNGSSVTVTATPSMKTYKFVNWTENGSTVSTDATYTFSITSDRNLVANFDVNQTTQFTIDLAVMPSGAGTATGSGTYTSGTDVTVTATPSLGYNFTGWSEGGITVSTSASYTFNISANRNLVANFVQQVQNYTLTTSVAPAAGGTSSILSATYTSGTSVTVTATPAVGYNFVNWTESGIQVSTSASYTFNITANRNLVANFVQQVQNYTLTTSVAPAAGGTSSILSATYTSGTSVTVTATPAAGYNFVNWTESGVQVSTSASYTFNITANRNLVANFEIKTSLERVENFQISVFPNPTSGWLNIEGVPEGSKITLLNKSGIVVYTSETIQTSFRIDLAKFVKGVYFMRVEDNHFQVTEKIIVR
jgi:hypothetical protein